MSKDITRSQRNNNQAQLTKKRRTLENTNLNPASELEVFKHQIASPLTAIICSIEQHLMEQDLRSYSSNKCESLPNNQEKLKLSHLEMALKAANEISEQVRVREKSQDYQNCLNFNLFELLTEAKESFKKPYPIDFNLDIATIYDFNLYGNPQNLKLVFTHLLNNAAEAYDRTATHKRIDIWAHHYHDGVLVAICDQGRGIKQETKEKLFEQNFSTKTDSKGIGLWEARQIIRNEFAGEIDLISQVNRGTAIFLYL